MFNPHSTGRCHDLQSYTERMFNADAATGMSTLNAEPIEPVTAPGHYRVKINVVLMMKTAKAAQVAREHDTHGGLVWLPLSQIKMRENMGRAGSYRNGMQRKVFIVDMPVWLFNKVCGQL